MEEAAEGERVPLREADGNVGGVAREVAVGVGEGVGVGMAVGAGADAGAPQWFTVDGPLGAHHEQALELARNFFYGGFCLLPWLWFANCFYFWPVLKNRHVDPLVRWYIVWSGVGCLTVTVILLAWSLTFAIGGESVVGSSWTYLAVYNIADKYGTAWAQ